jgi:hypothetical protein
MTVGLPAASRTRLAKLLALLGSDHAGERDAAEQAANRLVLKSGLTWEQVLDAPPDDSADARAAPR